MAVINVSLPDPVRDWVERGDYASVSDYLSDLVRGDQRDADEREAIVDALVRGERSGVSSRQVPDMIASLRSERGVTA